MVFCTRMLAALLRGVGAIIWGSELEVPFSGSVLKLVGFPGSVT